MTAIRVANAFLAELLSAVAERFHAPTDEFLTVRCIARPALIRALGEIRDRLNIKGSRQTSGTQLLDLLRQSGVAYQVPITGQRPNIPADRLYAIGLGADPDQLDPLEILQAHRPDGIICYFSAIQVHGLSTQLPTHHRRGRHTGRLSRSG